jgi:hypothetical protein
MDFSFHPEAEAEFFGAVDWYEVQEPGLGEEFADEVVSAILRVLEYPNAWPLLQGTIRRCLVNRFPFGLLYTVRDDEVFIVAVTHLRRSPDYWKGRAS